MNILLIAGHGAGDPGAIGTLNGKTYKEADLNREVVNTVAEKMGDYDAEVDIYDQSRNAYTDYQRGTLSGLAKFEQYDFVLEVHFNAIKADAGNGETKGVEIYAMPGSQIEPNICKNIEALGFKNRDVKSNGYAVISTARRKGARAALLEVCFIDDADDLKLYLSKKDQVAEAIVKGFGLKKKAVDPNRAKVQKRFGLDNNTMRHLDAHPYPAALYMKLATKK